MNNIFHTAPTHASVRTKQTYTPTPKQLQDSNLTICSPNGHYHEVSKTGNIFRVLRGGTKIDVTSRALWWARMAASKPQDCSKHVMLHSQGDVFISTYTNSQFLCDSYGKNICWFDF